MDGNFGMLLFFALALFQQNEWAQFRGPNASGVSEDTNLPVSFGPGENVVWKTPVPMGLSLPAWIDDLAPEVRATFRDRGRELVVALIDYLDTADAPDDTAGTDRLVEARRLAASYGREVAELGLSLADAVEGFLRFRRPFTETLGTIARRRGLDTREATALLAQAEVATDSLLVAVMTGHSLATGGRTAARRPTRPASAP